jgi:hypothetical protein
MHTGKVIARTTVSPLSSDEKSHPEVQRQISEFDINVRTKLGEGIGGHQEYAGNNYLEDVDDGVFEPIEPEASMPEVDAFDMGEYLLAKVQLPKGDGYQAGTVIQSKGDHEGNPMGNGNQNPILGT